MNHIFKHLLVMLAGIHCCFIAAYSQQSSKKSKRPTYMSIMAGYTNTSAYGSFIDKDNRSNAQSGLGEVEQTERNGMTVSVNFRKHYSEWVYLKTGTSYIYRSVNPQENTNVFYQTRLRSHHIAIPMLAGLNLFPALKKFEAAVELGPAASILVSDKSYVGPDRKEGKTSTVALSLCSGLSLSIGLIPSTRFQVNYTYMFDITNSHVQTLFWGAPDEPLKDFAYKYKTHCISAGFIWPL